MLFLFIHAIFNDKRPLSMTRFASVVVDGVLGPLRLARHTWRCPCISVVPEATHEASRGPEKGAVSAQKALRGSETETRELLGGTEENRVSPMRGHWFALQANQWVFSERKQKKIELVASPDRHNVVSFFTTLAFTTTVILLSSLATFTSAMKNEFCKYKYLQ